MEKRHFIFDIDGTLINTEKAIIQGLQELLMEIQGIAYEPEQLYFCLGIPGPHTLKQLGIEGDLTAVLKRWDAYYCKHGGDVTVYPDIRKVLDQLRENGISLGVITSKNQEEYDYDMIRLGLADYFSITVTSTDTTEHKPNPAPMLFYLERAGILPEQAVYIGDSIYDMECAKGAGVPRALALWGCKNPEEITADYRLFKPKNILDLLKKF